jgi:hypothetical protein
MTETKAQTLEVVGRNHCCSDRCAGPPGTYAAGTRRGWPPLLVGGLLLL